MVLRLRGVGVYFSEGQNSALNVVSDKDWTMGTPVGCYGLVKTRGKGAARVDFMHVDWLVEVGAIWVAQYPALCKRRPGLAGRRNSPNCLAGLGCMGSSSTGSAEQCVG